MRTLMISLFLKSPELCLFLVWFFFFQVALASVFHT